MADSTGCMSNGADAGRERKYLAVLILAVTAVYVAGLTPHWRISQDSARYLMMAHQIADGKPYWMSGNPQYGIPPGLPLYHAAVFKLTGFTRSLENYTERFTAVNAANILPGILTVLAAYFLVRQLAGSRAALGVAALVGFSHVFHTVTLDVMSDPPFCAATWAALCLLAKGDSRWRSWHFLLIAALLLIAVLFRTVGAVLVAVSGAYFAVRAVFARGARRSSVLGLLSVLPAAAVVLSIVLLDRSASGTAGFNYYSIALAGRSASTFLWRIVYTAASVPGIFFENLAGLAPLAIVSLPLLAVVIIGFVANIRRIPPVFSFYFVVYLALVGLSTGLDPRKAVPVLPLLCLYFLDGLIFLISRIARKDGNQVGYRHPAVVWLTVALVAANLVSVVKTTVKNHAANYYKAYSHGKWVDYLDLARGLQADPPQGRVMVPAWSVVYLLSGLETVATPCILPATETNELGLLEEAEVNSGFLRMPSAEYVRAVGDYVRANGVTAIIVDPERDLRGRAAREFVLSDPSRWTERAEFGRLTVYSLSEASRTQQGDTTAAGH